MSSSSVISLFRGKVPHMGQFPTIRESERETLSLVIDSLDKFLEPKAAEHRKFDKEGSQTTDYIDALKELGLFGLIIPEDNGGIGLSNAGYSRVLQQSTYYDGSTSLTIGAHSSIGMKGLLLFGTDSQKSNYLPKLASGEMIAAFCLTEPKAGSDAASINTKAKRNSDGSWTISGEKIWITNGPIADFFTVFAKTDEGMTAFIVERSFGGVTSGHKEDKMGIRSSSTSSVLFEEVVVPSENVLGDIGDGFKVAMAILNNGRTGLGGGCIGGMKRAISLACSHANERTQFSKKLSEFSLIQDKIARMSMRCYATESLVAFVAQAIDGGQDEYSLEAAVSKVYAAESLWIVANEALQIAGGTGYMAEYPYERIVRDSRINMIFEGTNEILRLFIALSGIKEVGKDLTDLQNSISEFFQKPLIGISRIAEYVLKKPPLAMSPEKQFHQEFSEEEGIVQKYCLALNSACEALAKKYRKSIVEQQQLIVRVADVAIDLFVCAAVLCRASNAKSDEKFHKELAKSIVQDAKRRMNQNLRRIDINEDEMLRSCGAKVLSEGRYPLDAAFE